jgi:quercetin dioxygenase-like cupin family protein
MTDIVKQPGLSIHVRLLEATAESSRKTVLLKSSSIEVIQFVIPAGKDIPTYETQGHIILHCLQGRVVLTALSATRELQAGDLLYLPGDEPFSLVAIQTASLLATIISASAGETSELIGD